METPAPGTEETRYSPHAQETALTPAMRQEALTLLASVFLVAACGLIYELLIATISSYLLGSSVTQFSLCIGTFIGAMGLGSYVSQFVGRNLLSTFLTVEIVLGTVGGLSAWTLFAAYAYLGAGYYVALFGLLILIGGLVGIELPLLTRLLGRYGALRTTIAHALSFDYVGSLLGSVAFPLVLLPLLGTTRTAFVVGLLNLGIAMYNLHVFRHRLPIRGPWTATLLATAGLAAGVAFADRGASLLERRLYEDAILFARQTPYQKIIITRQRDDIRLYLDGNIQFSANDEYRYHESLVHPAMRLSASREEVLILGGGDGLGVREALKYPDVRRVTLVDIDPEMTRLARTYPALVRLNENALNDPRVRVVHTDAFKFLEEGSDRYGVIIADLPDPNHEALAKLYAREFYRLARTRLGVGGVFVTQATSPLVAREAFWCIEKTMSEAGFRTTPYHVYVPSFGEWGFILAGVEAAPKLTGMRLAESPVPTRFLNSASAIGMAAFDADTDRVVSEPSTLDFPRILDLYEKGTRKWE
ncbi:MAG: polyamine aminopropyltransferase [Capsulimonadales bacterium]|nr:polyamine aminopropyltransferase [Capsulimonadales bacterium]